MITLGEQIVEVQEKKQAETDAREAAVNADANPTDDKEIMSAAALWCADQSPDGETCLVCGRKFGFNEEEGLKLLTRHYKQACRQHALLWYLNPDLGPDAMSVLSKQRVTADDDFIDPDVTNKGLEMVEEYDNPRFTHVPQSVKKKIFAAGHYGRWIARNNVSHAYDKGYRYVDRPSTIDLGLEDMHHQVDHADTKLRTGDLVYMMQPGPLRRRHEQHLENVTQERSNSLPASIEQKGSQMTDVGQKTYDGYIKRGLNHTNAMTFARRAEAEGRVLRSPVSEQSHHIHK